ncbi:snurportin-1 [Capsaspora owczarzaki ATCC 30864]|uniref:Snurportin-1 n=1 Tax=Capsaspora owczarzaki (strain ATCC 30864) TaxID=595528 RepID=A0A0D2VSS9_CAPO3|nr:snurportin-1 [Capsaspora owczarzaki ATCC 30864]KJE94202.1 snurportin-1 [Capsaspora owczarzaki ATCC 30864]|eukprot:XP_004347633.1 snurportin-1 [Capsaspora owczarzaki ATCC 30864]
MDELAAQLGSAAMTTGSSRTTHARQAQYKAGRQPATQAERRKKLLDRQKERRHELVDFARRLAFDELTEEDEHAIVAESESQSPETGDDNDEDNHYDDDDEQDEVDPDQDAPPRRPKGMRRSVYRNPYRHMLMQSESMEEAPADLEGTWNFLFCPLGRRCLVVSAKGQTTMRLRNGYPQQRFPSNLPGGNRKSDSNYNSSNFCILDCIFHEASKTFFVLDLMCWRGVDVFQTESDFRYFWLQSKLSEEGARLTTRSPAHPYAFVAAPRYSCNRVEMATLLAGFASAPPFDLDGLLFFHSAGHYTGGSTPLSLWLKPEMVGPRLGLDIPGFDQVAIASQLAAHQRELQKAAFLRERTIVIQQRQQQQQQQQYQSDSGFDNAPSDDSFDNGHNMGSGNAHNGKKSRRKGKMNKSQRMELQPGQVLPQPGSFYMQGASWASQPHHHHSNQDESALHASSISSSSAEHMP